MSVSTLAARRIEVHGVVQGVGFRPFVWRLATRLGVRGWVRNRSGVVEILAEGSPEALEAFCTALAAEAPPLARVENVRCRSEEPPGLEGFEVDVSIEGEGERLVSPDVATCEACLAEVLDPADRRHQYPFVNCTDCGPRFTIIESLPYDRERTSMRAFPMCEECEREYSDPGDRRFRAEPVACPVCGPKVTLVDRHGRTVRGDPVETAAHRIVAGAIVAVKGLGGFHLACDATNERAVAELRRRKQRPDKPFAVMVATAEEALEWFEPTATELVALSSWRAPIVLVRDRGRLAPSVAPGHRHQGAMLPATPLHHLLLRAAGRPLVMTSGNRSDEPICITDEDARERLGDVASLFLIHDRDIVSRYDDSVVRVWRDEPIALRRARGFAPAAITLPAEVAPVLGVGAKLNGAFCLASGTRAYLSQHVGDLEDERAMTAYRDALDRYRSLFAIEPEIVAHDRHPDFLTTRFAESLGLPTVAVQHHHAHVASVMAEHGLDGQVLGVAFDGFGLGEDDAAWGGEFLVAGWAKAERAAHLRAVRLPGGDAAVRSPVRMALAHAADAGLLAQARELMGETVTDEEVRVVEAQIESGLGSPWTTSAGRLFDAVAALTGTWRRPVTYEGQAAMLLEQVADQSATQEYRVELDLTGGHLVVDTRPVIAAVVKDLLRGRSAGVVAGRFHRTMAAAVLEVVRILRGQTGLDRVVLSGGVFQNALFGSDLAARIDAVGMTAYLPREAPPGDGGIALGQALVAHARTEGA